MQAFTEIHDANKGQVEILFRYFQPMFLIDQQNLVQYNSHQVDQPLTEAVIYHDTNLDSAVNIVKGGGFQGYSAPIGNGLGADFSWWTLDIPREDRQFLWYDKLSNGRGSPSPFIKKSESRYGNYRFPLRLEYVLHKFKEAHGCDEVFFRRMGTFIYTREVMYAIAVCPREAGMPPDDDLSGDFPGIPREGLNWNKSSPVALYNDPQEGRGLRWRVQSPHDSMNFVNKLHHPLKWDTVCLGFYLPNGMPMMDDYDLSDCVHFVKTSQLVVNDDHDRFDPDHAEHAFNLRV